MISPQLRYNYSDALDHGFEHRVAVPPYTMLESWWHQHLYRGRLPVNAIGRPNTCPIDALMVDLGWFMLRNAAYVELPPPTIKGVKLFLRAAASMRLTRQHLAIFPSLPDCRVFFMAEEVPDVDWAPALSGNVIEVPVSCLAWQNTKGHGAPLVGLPPTSFKTLRDPALRDRVRR